VSSGPEVIKFDPRLRRTYTACYGGAISVFQEEDPDHYGKLEKLSRTGRKCIVLQSIPKPTGCTPPEVWVDRRPAARMVVYDDLPGK
jgi:hypothetical protein